MVPKEKLNIVTGCIQLWEVAALLLSMQVVGAKSLEAGVGVSCVQMCLWQMLGCTGLGDNPNGTWVACGVDELLC